jgi:tetratricopeptide (TPR) repeat protein
MTSRENSHLEEHRREMQQFLRLCETDLQGALAFARSAVEKFGRRGRNDQRRGDALEFLAVAYSRLRQFDRAIEPATELVRIRRAAKPLDYELLGLALGTQATALFALGRSEETDKALREQLASWRNAFPPEDLRLAQKLEGHAEYVQKGFGRTEWAIELLKEAVEIRKGYPESSRGKLADTLQELAILQLRLAEYGEANANLAKARTLLRKAIAVDPSGEENKAGLAQVLVLRSGIAGALAQKEKAIAEAEAARNIKFEDRVLQAENEILVAAALSSVLELRGDIPAAIAEQNKVLDVYFKNDDLLASGSLDKGGISDTLSWLGSLYLEQNELDLARQAITTAREQLGDTSDLLFKMAELERKSGNAEAALQNYREALRLRKESASEVSLLFGTNRLLESDLNEANFAGKPGDHVSAGEAVVLVPGAQFSTEVWLEAPAPPIPVGAATNPERLRIRSKSVLSSRQFKAKTQRLTARARLYPRSALVFVHG